MPRIVALAIATEEQKEFVHAVVAEQVDIVILRTCQLAISSDAKDANRATAEPLDIPR